MPDDPPSRTQRSIVIDGALYVAAAMLPPSITFIQSTDVITTRGIIAVSLSCLLAGVIALKTFRSQGISPP